MYLSVIVDTSMISLLRSHIGTEGERLITFSFLLLKLSFQESENYLRNKKDYDGEAKFTSGIFSMLEQIPHIAQTKVPFS